MSKLVIAEKPMLARDIARAITGKEVSESARLPISGNGYTVCACAGHLLELVKPDAIDPKWGMPWSLDVLPIEVHDWPKEPAVDKKTGESKKPLIDQIAGLLKTCDSVIAAGDPDDEGQLIVDELLDYLGYAGKVERVYVNDNIEKNIVKAFDKLVPNDSCRGAGNAAYTHHCAKIGYRIHTARDYPFRTDRKDEKTCPRRHRSQSRLPRQTTTPKSTCPPPSSRPTTFRQVTGAPSRSASFPSPRGRR